MIAIVPARGGSKGLPGKNIKLLNGKPLIQYTIEAALQAKEVDRVIISTDDEKIADIAKSIGAEFLYLRPAHLATDIAKSIDVYLDLIQHFSHVEKKEVNEIVVLQPTSPLREASHIDQAIELFWNNNADSVISYCEEHHPVFWHKFISEHGEFVNIFPKDYLLNRQQLKTSYYPNGAIYVFKTDLLKRGDYYTEKSYAYIMNRNKSIDIDTLEDFQYCEFLLNR